MSTYTYPVTGSTTPSPSCREKYEVSQGQLSILFGLIRRMSECEGPYDEGCYGEDLCENCQEDLFAVTTISDWVVAGGEE